MKPLREASNQPTRENAVSSILFNQVRKGNVILEDGQLYTVVDKELNAPGNWRAMLHLKLKNLNTGAVTMKRARPEDKVELAYLDKREMQYLYAEGDGYVFMDNESYDQITLGKEWIGDQILYLKENDNVQVVLYEGRPISLELPDKVELVVTETAPGIKGATAQAQYKEATVETGLKVQVPSFVETGEKIALDTRTGEYLSRVKG
jgi:elongation factor P